MPNTNLSTNSFSLPHFVILTFFLFLAGSVQSAPIYYTFDGVISGFASATGLANVEDYGVVLNETEISYTFEIDFDRDTSTHTNSAATWNYFYSDSVLGEPLVIGERVDINRYGYDGYFNSGNHTGRINGSNSVSVKTFSSRTSNWRVEDWIVGQELSFQDSGYFYTGGLGAVYLFGSVELTSISSIFPIEVSEPSSLILFVSALGFIGLGMLRRRPRS